MTEAAAIGRRFDLACSGACQTVTGSNFSGSA